MWLEVACGLVEWRWTWQGLMPAYSSHGLHWYVHIHVPIPVLIGIYVDTHKQCRFFASHTSISTKSGTLAFLDCTSFPCRSLLWLPCVRNWSMVLLHISTSRKLWKLQTNQYVQVHTALQSCWTCFSCSSLETQGSLLCLVAKYPLPTCWHGKGSSQDVQCVFLLCIHAYIVPRVHNKWAWSRSWPI